MIDNQAVLIGLSTLFASIPAIIWIYILFQKKEKSRKTILLVFLLGCFTAPALLGLQFLWNKFPNFNLAQFITENAEGQSTAFILTFMLFGAMEEIIKLYVVRIIDKKTLLINTVDDAIRYSFAAALGFSFTENIYYLYQFWPSISGGELIGMYIFRSTFTTCAHLIFSGILGYYYGIGKFSIDIANQAKVTGKIPFSTRIIQKVFALPISQAFQQQMIFKGLIIAIGAHAIYNYLLQYSIILPVILFVIIGYLYLQFLLSRKAGNLILTTDITTKKKGMMGKKDEEVVIELLGMWFNEKKYVDVIHICERLLQRDPDNNVIKLFKAKALDKMDEKSTYREILNTVVKTKEDLSENDQSVISKYIAQKAQQQKDKNPSTLD